MYEIYLPVPPTVNNYYVKTKRGVFISQKGRKFRAEVEEAVNEQLPGVFIDDRMLVEVVFYFPDKRTRDLGNYDKALMDALTECGLWEDDSLIDQQFFYRGELHKGGLVFLRISEAGPILRVDQRLPED
jgi:crossover junction endodeoxyribonuclease RusA